MSKEFTYQPGPQQWKRYLDGTMSPGEKQLFDDFLQHDEFAREALEGYTADPGALEYFTQSQQTLAQLPGPAANRMFLKATLITVTIVSAVTVSYLIWPKQPTSFSQHTQELPALSEQTYAVLDSEMRVIESFTPLAVNNQLRVEDKKDHTEVTLPNQTENLTTDVVIPVEEIIPDKKELEIETPEVKPNRIVKTMPLLSFYDHKVIDYSQEYTAPIEKRTLVMEHTPANMEGPNTKVPETDERIERIPYNVYLKETMRYVNARQYRTALKRFKVIQAHYPADLNSFFYSGICYYNLGRGEEAMAALDQCIINEITEFKPEAEWCKALVLLEKGRKKEATKLLKQIETDNGFYSQQAKEKLLTLK